VGVILLLSVGTVENRCLNFPFQPIMFTSSNSVHDGWLMVFNVTFSNILAILWLSVLLVEETGVPGKNHRPVTSH